VTRFESLNEAEADRQLRNHTDPPDAVEQDEVDELAAEKARDLLKRVSAGKALSDQDVLDLIDELTNLQRSMEDGRLVEEIRRQRKDARHGDY